MKKPRSWLMSRTISWSDFTLPPINLNSMPRLQVMSDKQCTYPNCKCPYDMGADNRCIHGLPRMSKNNPYLNAAIEQCASDTIKHGTAFMAVNNDGSATKISTQKVFKTPDELIEPLSTQVGGDHYRKLKIQPVEYIHANGINFFAGNAIKYLTRYESKGGKQDLEKAKHFIDLLIKFQYGD